VSVRITEADYRRLMQGDAEADFQRDVVEFASARGWWHYHTRDSRRSPAGFPDLVLARASDKRLVLAELKTNTGQLTDDVVRKNGRKDLGQKTVIALLQACHREVYVWRPRDWDEIVKALL
jgi:hypothetical protein